MHRTDKERGVKALKFAQKATVNLWAPGSSPGQGTISENGPDRVSFSYLAVRQFASICPANQFDHCSLKFGRAGPKWSAGSEPITTSFLT